MHKLWNWLWSEVACPRVLLLAVTLTMVCLAFRSWYLEARLTHAQCEIESTRRYQGR